MIKLENHQFSPYNVITDSDKDQDAEIIGSLGIENSHKASSHRLLIMTKKKCLCRCGNPTIHLTKWSSSVPHWGPPWGISRSLLWQWGQQHCRNSIPTNLTWMELQGEKGVYPECATLGNIKWSGLFPTYRTIVFTLLHDGQGLEASWGDRLFASAAPALRSSSLVWLPFPRHPSTSWLKAWALLSRENLYLQVTWL